MSKNHHTTPFYGRKQLEKRFWAKVTKGSRNGCWLWRGSLDRDGYGSIRLGLGRIFHETRAHRIAWRLIKGQIPGSLCVLHSCDVRNCVNPEHLFLGTNADNNRDMILKGRNARGDKSGARLHPETLARGDRNGSRLYPERLIRGDRHWARLHPEKIPRGEKNGAAKLTAVEVLKIRSLCKKGMTQGCAARKFGVSKQLISVIIRREAWIHI